MLYIRTDSNNKIATGHVMRCISIAKAMEKNNEEVIFITSDHNSDELIISNGFRVICLNSKWNDLNYEVETLIDIILKNKIEKLLIDSYFVTKEYLESLKKYTKLIYIDDLNLFTYPVDLLINYSDSYKKFMYDVKYKNIDIRILKGYKYIPLREEFQNVIPSINNNVKSILFTMGGSDEKNLTLEFIRNIIKNKKYNNIEFNIVVGRFNSNLHELKKIVSNISNINLHYNVSNMAEIMLESDIAISAGGTTLFELCSCGIPTISFIIADNQEDGTRSLESEGIVLYAGDIRLGIQKCINTILLKIELMLNDVKVRERLSINMRNIVDGNGVYRIAKEIKML